MERVTRIRGGGWDRNGDPVPTVEKDLIAAGVAPASSITNKDRGRNGRDVAYTVFFFPAVDLTDEDRLVVRGEHVDITVHDWVSPYTGRRGMEVLASRGKG